ncbi:MAG: hypothetical protein AAGK23_11865 [Pseudomonadota bacterium]
MSRANFIRSAACISALIVLGSCATSPGPTDEAADTALAAKPTAEDIATAERADPLTRANFWNTQYNLHPTDLDISISFSEALRDIGSDERSAEVARLTAVSHPDDYRVQMELGRAETAAGNLAEAVRAYVRASELDPFSADPFAAIGGIYDSREQHEVAQDAYRRALTIDANRPATLSNYGMSLALSGNLAGAEEKLRQATALDGATVRIRQNLALILGLRGKFAEAREISSIDAPIDLAEMNTDFLAQMLGASSDIQRASTDQLSLASAPGAIVPEVPLAMPTPPILDEAMDAPAEDEPDLAGARRTDIDQTVRRPKLRGGFSGD